MLLFNSWITFHICTNPEFFSRGGRKKSYFFVLCHFNAFYTRKLVFTWIYEDRTKKEELSSIKRNKLTQNGKMTLISSILNESKDVQIKQIASWSLKIQNECVWNVERQLFEFHINHIWCRGITNQSSKKTRKCIWVTQILLH